MDFPIDSFFETSDLNCLTEPELDITMARMSQTVKEILQLVLFLLIIGVLLTFLVIYPLNRTKAIMARDDIDDFNVDSLPLNDPALFVQAGLFADTFTVEPDAVTSLACLYLTKARGGADSVRGTAILLHDERLDRTSMLQLSSVLADSGFAVVVYDQRATGLSGSKYHGDGQLEATDLEEVIPYLEIRERAIRPIWIVGRSLGADAGLLAALEEERIEGVVAIDPYLTTTRMLDSLRTEHETLWIPFFRTIFWWWYEIRSSYAVPYRTTDDIRAVRCRTLVLTSPDRLNDVEILRLKELSEASTLEIETLPSDDATLIDTIVRFMMP